MIFIFLIIITIISFLMALNSLRSLLKAKSENEKKVKEELQKGKVIFHSSSSL